MAPHIRSVSGVPEIKDFGTDFNYCKSNGVSVSEIRVTKERSSFFAWQPISFGEGFLYPLTMVRTGIEQV
jgi:hypothetical protein